MRALLVAGSLALGIVGLLRAGEPERASAVVSQVWAGHPVGFAFQATHDRLFVAFYDAERRLTVGQRAVSGGDWQLFRPEGAPNAVHRRMSNVVGWDSHNSLTFAFDADGYIHLSGNMHVDPLVYYRSAKPWDITTLERVDRMTGDRETRCTYPVFFKDKAGALYFRYRDGASGNGSDIYNRYDTATRTWAHLLDTPLHDGQGHRNAYASAPIAGPDGRFHIAWVWRDTPDAATNHTLSYIRSADLRHWEDAHGRAVALPVTLGGGDVIDDAKPGGGLVNTTYALGFDRQQRPVIVYHKYDAEGRSQVFAARPTSEGWLRRPITAWNFRWDFGGGGTILTDVQVRAPVVAEDGLLVVYVSSNETGGQRIRVDPETLAPVGTLPPERPLLPRALLTPSARDFVVHTAATAAGGRRFVLRWETLPANRDRPRPSAPPPSELRLYEFAEPRP